jgi:hypothetical protein
MTLQELLDMAIQHQLIKETRIEPMRTAVRHYAAMLGVDPAACLPAVYDIADHQLSVLVQAHAPADWNRRTRSTFSNHLPSLTIELCGSSMGAIFARRRVLYRSCVVPWSFR